MTPKRIFITYGTKNFDLQKKHIINLAKSSNFFDECISYGPNDLQKSFVQKHENILRLEKGAGFWIWKYQIIKQTIDQLKENGLLIIEHTKYHSSEHASEMDPFGVKPTVMPYVLTKWFGSQISIEHIKVKKDNMNVDAWLFFVSKNKKNVIELL